MKKGFLALVISLVLVFLLAPTEVSAAEGTALTSAGGELSSGNYYLAGDVTLTNNITIPSGVTVIIDLNGYTLTGASSGSVITVNGTLSLMDSSSGNTGKLTGGRKTGSQLSDGGGGVYVSDYGSFTMSGGTISENSSSNYGGGVYVKSGSFTMSGGTISGNSAVYGGGVSVHGGSFIMSGGTISGNSATSYGGGVYVSNGGSFAMSGGTISGNSASNYGGGVYVSNSSTFEVSESPVVNGNTNGNVRLYSYVYITLGGQLTTGASIGVTTLNTPTSDSAVQITTTETSTTYYNSAVNYITSDNENYNVRINSGGYLELYMLSITGSVEISGNVVYGQTLTATVSDDVPAGVNYQWTRDGTDITGATGSTYTLTAEDVGKDITVVVSHSSYAGSLTDTVTVSPATLTPYVSGTTEKTYDGTTKVTSAQGLSIALSGIVSGDDVTASAASYAYDSADVGTNRTITATGITLSGSAAGCYTLSSDTATVTASITAASLTENMFTVDATAETYTGSAITKAITTSLIEGTDYEVTCSDNISAGMATISITGLGNYTGTLTWNFTIEPKTVSAILSGTTSKGYDGTTDLPGDNTLTLTLEGVVDADKDNVTVSAGSIAYQDADAGTTKTLAVTGITLGGSAAGNYQLSSTSITVSAAEGQYVITPAAQSISYSTGSVSTHINDAAFTNVLTQTTVDGTITYSSDNTKVATVDANGRVSIVGAGTATITATAAATNNYNKATASYTLTVTAHAYEAVETDTTCTDESYITYTCTECGASYTETIPAAGHRLIHVEAKDPTATENGNIEYWFCEVCGKYFCDIGATSEVSREELVISVSAADEVSTVSAAATGDSGNLWLWGALALLFGLGAVLIIVYRRKTHG